MTEQEVETLWSRRYALRDMTLPWIATVLFVIVWVVLGRRELTTEDPWLPAGLWLRIILQGLVWGVPILLVLRQICRTWYRSTIQYSLTRVTSHDRPFLVVKEGIVLRHTVAVDLHIDRSDLYCTQSLVERWLGVGKIHVEFWDPRDPTLVLRGVRDVEHVYRLILVDCLGRTTKEPKSFISYPG